jgi:glycosyltransferase involved in cell wall biosynthesis
VRVLFVSHTYTLAFNQAKLAAIARTGKVELGLIAPRRWPAQEWNRLIEFEASFQELHAYPSSVFLEGRSGGYLYPPVFLLNVLEDFKPDLIQVEQEFYSLSALELAVLSHWKKTPLVIFSWENVDRRLFYPRALTRKYVLGHAAHVIAGSRGAAELALAWGFAGPITVLPQLGVDREVFAPRERRHVASRLKVGYIGRLTRGKGVDLLLRAVREATDAGHEVSVLICGAGPEEARLRDLARELWLEQVIDWRGAVPHDKVPEVMGEISLLVLPSRRLSDWREQFGHILIEAMSMGVPVVGSACGAIPEVVGRPELIFEEENHIALAKIIIKAVEDAAWLSEMGRYGEERVNGEYTHEVIARRLITLWEDVLNARGASYSHAGPPRR